METQIAANRHIQLKNGIKPVHEAFADYMLINPGCRLREMAGHFGYTVAWISTVLNTDMFRAYMAERRSEINAAVAEDLPSKLRAAAHLATERIMEVLEKTEDADTIVDCFDKVLHRYGYAPNAKGGAQQPAGQTLVGVQNNVFYLTKEELGNARGKLIEAHSNKTEELVVLSPGRDNEGESPG